MPTFTQDDATCEIFTYKAGLLSAVGHDLLLRCTRFELTVDEESASGTFDGTALEVVGAMKGGAVQTGVLSAKDCADILANIRNAVFKRHEAGRITFESDDFDIDGDTAEGDGTLTIPPRAHDLDFEVSLDDGKAVCEVVLHQPDWGITPFSALMGTLKVKPDVRVRITVPWTN